jgi:hypothetical protein|tara:strand:+ start:299 stop:781 length:483 start_codon:yes stop_codon:yes gene_type:complete
MGFKMKGFPMHKSASALKHKKDTDHRHGPGYIPEEYKDEFRKYRKSLMDQGIKMEGEYDMDPSSPTFGEYVPSEADKLLQEWRDKIKTELNDSTMPTTAQIIEQGLQFGNIPGKGSNVIEVTGEVTKQGTGETVEQYGEGNVETEKGKERRASSEYISPE